MDTPRIPDEFAYPAPATSPYYGYGEAIAAQARELHEHQALDEAEPGELVDEHQALDELYEAIGGPPVVWSSDVDDDGNPLWVGPGADHWTCPTPLGDQ